MLHFHPEKVNGSIDKSRKCKNCGAGFSSIQKLKVHVQRPRDENGKCKPEPVNGLKTKPREKIQGFFPCTHCTKRFYLKTQLEKHLNTHDACVRPLICNDCNNRFRTKFELQEHINVVHLNIKPFECKTCGKKFGYRKDLVSHERFHTGKSN